MISAAALCSLVLALFILNVNCGTYGNSDRSTSYSNHFRDLNYENFNGYNYPKKSSNYFYKGNNQLYVYPQKKYYEKNYKFDHSQFKTKYNTKSYTNKNNQFHYKDDSEESDEEKIFSYDENDEYGPSRWDQIDPQCNGQMQSPISIHESNSSRIRNPKMLQIDGMDLKPSSIEVENNGHSFKISLNFPNQMNVKIRSASLSNSYILEGIHWHWGRNDNFGSEHMINLKRYSAEMHLVFYNSKYDSLSSASSESDGLAVLAILYDLDEKYSRFNYDNPWRKLVRNVINAKSKYTEDRNMFTIRDIIKTDNFDYYSYSGSLSTPNCKEDVSWIVSTKPIPISSGVLSELRKIRNEKGERILYNFRPIQHSNRRKVNLTKKHNVRIPKSTSADESVSGYDESGNEEELGSEEEEYANEDESAENEEDASEGNEEEESYGE